MPAGPQPGSPPDPTDPEAKQATIDQLRDLITNHKPGESPWEPEPAEVEAEPKVAPPCASGASKDPQSHEEWVEAGREIALRQLNFSARSSHQLREAMAARDVPAGARDEVISRLTRVGLIDDAEYAAMLVRTRQSERGLARRALMVELTRKGIDRQTAELALEQIDGSDEAEAARELVRKRVGSMRTLDPTKRRNRLYGMLGRKGYSSSAARSAIDEVLSAEGLELY